MTLAHAADHRALEQRHAECECDDDGSHSDGVEDELGECCVQMLAAAKDEPTTAEKYGQRAA